AVRDEGRGRLQGQRGRSRGDFGSNDAEQVIEGSSLSVGARSGAELMVPKENSMNRAKALLIGLILMMALAVSERFWMTSAAAQAQPAAPREFITKGSGTFNGQQAHYVATVGETILKDEAGAATAGLFSTSYVREDVNDKARRPVIFAFNGGPGASS